MIALLIRSPARGCPLLQNEYPFIRLSGNAFDAGGDYGATAVDAITHNVHTYFDLFSRFGGLSRDEARARALRFVPIISKFAPELMEEISGIAAGSGVPLQDVVALNVRTELMFGLGSKAGPPRECTVVGAIPQVTADGHTYLAQNWDFIARIGAACVLLEIDRGDRGSVVTFTEAGIVGKVGFNSSGLGVCLNLLMSDYDRGELKIPQHILLRQILNEARCVGDAIKIIAQAGRASSANYALGSEDGCLVNIEATPDDFDYVHPRDGVLVHTNHFESPRLNVRDLSKVFQSDTIVRSWEASEKVRPHIGRIDAEVIQDVLRDHMNFPSAICRHRDEREAPEVRLETMASLVMDLDDRVLYLADGQPCQRPYRKLAFPKLRSAIAKAKLDAIEAARRAGRVKPTPAASEIGETVATDGGPLGVVADHGKVAAIRRTGR